MSEKWPIIPWRDNTGKQHYKVEDDQGYNFSFDRMDDAIWYQRACGVYTRIMKSKLKPMVDRLKEEALS